MSLATQFMFLYTQILCMKHLSIFSILKKSRLFVVYYVICTISALCLSHCLNARHIIGGDISYECLGNGMYHVTMKIYRDCSNPNADYFDISAPITIFRGNAAPYWQFRHIYASLQLPVGMIPPDNSNPCLMLPPNICVEEGIYEFDVELPPSDETYHIVYQRCCRNSTISNIYSPDETGATYTIELTPQAQALCNDSPVFNNFPPIVICAGEPLQFDHSATDAEGDQLVYELCSPLKGAGVRGFLIPGDPTLCDGFRPDPACPPPFPNVDFRLPNYSHLAPLAGEPTLSIDPNTGLITGTPIIQGQFVVGICVSEFRNGELLSITQRDFQFNVANCEPTVVAAVEADETPDDRLFIINACDNPVTFMNESFQQSFIDEFFWTFDINGQTETFNTWNAEVLFPDNATYHGQLILNPNTDCGDTAFITVNVFPPLHPDFSFEYDTCVAGPVQFTDLTSSEIEIESWLWRFGDDETDEKQHPSHLYRDPGDFVVTLRVVNENGCSESISRSLAYRPVPALIVISPNTFIGCAPADIFFDNLSFPIDDTYDIEWSFGDGGSSGTISPTHHYESEGVFDISISITSPIGCQTDTLFPELITVEPSPTAAFSYSPGTPSNLQPEVQFSDQSIGAISWFWNFNDLKTSFEQNPVFSFPDTGLQKIQLIVTHPQGCQDTSVQVIDIIPDVRYFLPNAFTPNSDSVNDFFSGVGTLIGVQNFHLTIWNRWGELIFETRDPQEAWNGQKNNAGMLAPNGLYVCRVSFSGPRGNDFLLEGFVSLVR